MAEAVVDLVVEVEEAVVAEVEAVVETEHSLEGTLAGTTPTKSGPVSMMIRGPRFVPAGTVLNITMPIRWLPMLPKLGLLLSIKAKLLLWVKVTIKVTSNPNNPKCISKWLLSNSNPSNLTWSYHNHQPTSFPLPTKVSEPPCPEGTMEGPIEIIPSGLSLN